jgi:hypothetical protein
MVHNIIIFGAYYNRTYFISLLIVGFVKKAIEYIPCSIPFSLKINVTPSCNVIKLRVSIATPFRAWMKIEIRNWALAQIMVWLKPIKLIIILIHALKGGAIEIAVLN